MKAKITIVAIVSVLAIWACGSRYAASPSLSGQATDEFATAGEQLARRQLVPMEEPALGKMATNKAAPGTGGAGGLAVLEATKPDRYLIKNATLTIETEDARAATAQVTAALEQVGGYVSNLQESVNAFGKRTVVMQVRVPSDRFDQSMLQVETLGKLMNKQVTTEDVTEQYVDTEARARNLKRTEERLLEHLSRAGVLEEVLKVEQELTRIREEIERLEGRLRFLSDRVAYSTIAITLQETAKTEPMVPAKTFSSGKVFSEAVRSLVEFFQVIWVRVIWVIVWSPVWLVLAIVLRLAYLRYRRRHSWRG